MRVHLLLLLQQQVKGVWALPFEVAALGLVGVAGLMIFFTMHSVCGIH